MFIYQSICLFRSSSRIWYRMRLFFSGRAVIRGWHRWQPCWCEWSGGRPSVVVAASWSSSWRRWRLPFMPLSPLKPTCPASTRPPRVTGCVWTPSECSLCLVACEILRLWNTYVYVCLRGVRFSIVDNNDGNYDDILTLLCVGVGLC